MLVALYGLYLAFVLRPARGAAVLPKGEPVTWAEVLFTFLPPMLLIVSVLGSILAGVATATEAAGLGAVGAMLLASWQGLRFPIERWLRRRGRNRRLHPRGPAHAGYGAWRRWIHQPA